MSSDWKSDENNKWNNSRIFQTSGDDTLISLKIK